MVVFWSAWTSEAMFAVLAPLPPVELPPPGVAVQAAAERSAAAAVVRTASGRRRRCM